MRVIAYDVRDDEIVYLNKVAKELNIEIKICQYTLTTENVEEINGSYYIEDKEIIESKAIKFYKHKDKDGLIWNVILVDSE